MVSEVQVYGGARGKMAGVPHISVASGDDIPTCAACTMKKICYARRFQTIYPNPRRSYQKNGVKITSRVLDRKELPYVNGNICRFNAFGELYSGEKGKIQLTNYVNIAKKSPDTIFVLWSRNYRMVESFFKTNDKPENMKLIRSTADINTPVDVISPGWDGVFNVVTKEYAEQNDITINCGLKDENGDKIGCARCYTGCYRKNVRVVCYEIKK